MSKIKVKQMTDCIWLFNEPGGCSAYLIIGEEKACLIDTMEGEENIYELVRSITDKDIVVVNTHGHPDHVHGNIYFEKIIIHENDLPMAEMFTGEKQKERASALGRGLPIYSTVKEGDELSLGGKTLAVYELFGHTPGGILFLLKEDRILFTGDAVNHHIWLQLDGCVSVEEYAENVGRVLFLEEKADRILHGHADGFDDISLIRCLYNGLCDLKDGKTDADSEYNFFGGKAKQHPFALLPDKEYENRNSVICYRETNVLRK